MNQKNDDEEDDNERMMLHTKVTGEREKKHAHDVHAVRC